jgi:4-azaleucine resistance transporter AzlC
LLYQQELICAFRASIPIMAGYILLGAAFAILAVSFSLNVVVIILMSVFIYAGALQFISLSFINAKLGLIDAFITSLLIGVRQIFYSLSFLKKYQNTHFVKTYLFFALTDETYGLLTTLKIDKKLNKKYYYLFLSALNQLYWVLGTVLGVVIGSADFLATSGIEFSLTALFVVLAIEQYKKIKRWQPFTVAFVVSIVAIIFVGSANMLIFSIAVSLLLSFLLIKVKKK